MFMDCVFECLSSLWCVLYNYEEGNKEFYECELNSERKECKIGNLMDKVGYFYYGIEKDVSKFLFFC